MKLRLDWRAYFQGFCEQHGKPVNWKGRLLFPDGWTYSRTEYKGPEWPPPKDKVELAEMREEYWQLRLQKAEDDLKEVKRLYENLKEQQESRSAPLKYGTRYYDEENQGYRRGTADVSLPAVQDEVTILEEELKECQRQLTTASERVRPKSNKGSRTTRSSR